MCVVRLTSNWPPSSSSLSMRESANVRVSGVESKSPTHRRVRSQVASQREAAQHAARPSVVRPPTTLVDVSLEERLVGPTRTTHPDCERPNVSRCSALR
jgi:hypothetical protein